MAETSNYSVVKLLFLGFIFHLVFIYSVFDCYFTSPVVHGMERFNAGAPEAKRLVLIVGDGLRADLLFEKNGFYPYPRSPKIVAPHLRAIAEDRGAFGVSHTRVPTESRPGHVAMIAGMYEDVSAVTKGWKVNPVDFDSVFNQSSHTFAFGSPDIIPMFQHGATPGKVKGWTYNEEDEDFTKDATALDVWVLDNFKTMLKNATTDPVLDSQLKEDKVIIFLHLLGLDTTGHSYRPHSREYMKNIQVVDNIVKETEELISAFYGDSLTSYIFTADHGMSVIGNHGDGNPDSTRTPFIAWGRGIRGPLTNSQPSSHDAYSKRWEMSSTYRRDIEQADITPMISTLLGIDWPANSVGVLPDVDPRRPGFLSPNGGAPKVANASLTNAKMILEHYRIKHEQKKAKKFLYTPFAPLEAPANSSTTLPYHLHAIETIERHIAAGNDYLARMGALELINRGLEGLRYLETYQRTLIRAIVAAAYTGWAAYAALYVFRPLETNPQSKAQQANFASAVHYMSFFVFSVFCAMFALEEAPWTYYLYTAFPCYFWDQAISQASTVMTRGHIGDNVKWLLIRASLVVVVLVTMVYGYTHRSIWSVGLVFVGFIWPRATWSQATKDRLGVKYLLWTVSCLLTAVFPLLNVNKEENIAVITAGGYVLAAVGSLQAYLILQNPNTHPGLRELYIAQISFVVGMVSITRTSALSLQAKAGLPPVSQGLAWAVLLTSSAMPLISPVRHTSVDTKLLMHILALGPLFVVLSISDEALFFVSYSITLSLWIDVETALAQTSESRNLQRKKVSKGYTFEVDDLRIVLFFLFFVQVAFFGTGNVASMSSFYLAPVYRLIPVFNPFFMAVPLLCKIIAPYVILSIAIASVTHALKLAPFSLFLISLMITDGMTLTFFFNVRDTGSWLEIGQTISFFVITSLLTMFSGGVCAIGECLMVDVFAAKDAQRAKLSEHGASTRNTSSFSAHEFNMYRRWAGHSIPKYDLSYFLKAALPTVSTKVVYNTYRALRKDGSIATTGRWKWYPTDPYDMQMHNSRKVYEHLETISEAVVAAAQRSWPEERWQRQSVRLRCRGDRVDQELLQDADDFLQEFRAFNSVTSIALEAVTYDTYDTYLNHRKSYRDSAQMLFDDPRRRFRFGLTVENTSMRFWYFSPTISFGTTSFDFIAKPKPLIHFLLATSFATEQELGYDPTVMRMKYGKEWAFKYKVEDGEKSTWYRTIRALETHKAFHPSGGGVRLWEVERLDEDREPSSARADCEKATYILKDHYPLMDLPSESDVQGEIIHRAHKVRRGDIANIKKHFMTIRHDAIVKLNGQDDDVRLHSRKPPPVVRDYCPLEERDHQAPNIRDILSRQDIVPPPPRVHRRLVYKELGTTLDEMLNQRALAKSLIDALEGTCVIVVGIDPHVRTHMGSAFRGDKPLL
ncbi:Glycosyl phosphatidyl inositol anchor synthesis [Marasmius crinis-equi]|uniref:GPI ethanolamine phosphate transferase 1 n=1 Tax=Marasmius crinis-equi TaxID=585013 RepID=A0ABR3EYL2_9AGAR